VVKLPAPTAWPISLAFGVALLFAGLITSLSVLILGVILLVVGCVGWFLDVFPHEKHVEVAVAEEPVAITTSRSAVARLEIAPELPRALLPLETYPVSAGVKGGLAGAVAMAVLACLYGIIKQGSIWYPINLLAASVYAQSVKLEPGQLSSFHPDSFALALMLHVLVSASVGLLYGAMLPMFAKRPILLGGLIGPVLWSGLEYSMLSLLNPLLESHIDWPWFIASQVAFGVVAGLVVERHPRVPTRENVAFAIRAGVEAPGTIPARGERP
jgi:hypothetical protein